MDFDTKEQLKALLNFSKVPYCVILNSVRELPYIYVVPFSYFATHIHIQDGTVHSHGKAHGMDFSCLSSLANGDENAPNNNNNTQPALVFDEDF